LPEASQVSNVILNEKALTPADFHVKENFSLLEVSLPVVIKAGESPSLKILYQGEQPLPAPTKYQLQVLNQPSVNPNFTLLIEYPSQVSARSSQKTQFATPGQVRYNIDLSKPFFLTLSYD
jgi:hypothetical protein